MSTRLTRSTIALSDKIITMDRTLILDTVNKVGDTVKIEGYVQSKRDHGKIAFLDVSDRSGLIQVFATGDLVAEVGVQYAVSIEGKIAARPEKLVNKEIATGTVELQAEKVEILAKSAELPFDMGQKDLDLQLPTLLDYRTLTLRHPKIQDIFKVQSTIVEGFRNVAKELGCIEIIVPTIAATASEGGSEVFRVDYYDYKAYMTQSPQLYKQMLVPALERVWTIAKAYRAEPSVTTRHLSEATQMDCEFGFVTFTELLDLLEQVATSMFKYTEKNSTEVLKDFGFEPVSYGNIPRLKMREAQQIIFERTGRDNRKEKDLEPEDEREICRWAKEEHNSDFVTVTHYPTLKRSFYTLPDPEDPEFSLSYDLLFRGVEILSGSQRVNDYDQFLEIMKSRGMNPEDFEMYLQAFKYGMPPEGGFSFGLERLTMLLLGLQNVREASLFPRDMERVDIRLSTLKKDTPKKDSPKKPAAKS